MQAMSARKSKKPRRTRNRAPVYPWKEWFARPEFTLYKGKHFKGATYGMAQQLRNWAGRLGKRIHIRILDAEDTIVVQVEGYS